MDRARDLEAALHELLAPQLHEITDAVVQPLDKHHPFVVPIPDPNEIDDPVEVLGATVARAANYFARAARFAGLARAEAKLARGRYEREYKRHRVGKNDAEREAAGLDAAVDDHTLMCAAEAVAELAESFEAAARIASESARKLYDKAWNMTVATRREEAGVLREADFRPY